MTEPFVVGVTSQKGGVGKTTVSVNLATALKLLGYRVLLIDADTSNPSVGFHLGLSESNLGYRDVLIKHTPIKSASAIHGPTGLSVIPGTIHGKAYMPTEVQMKQLARQLKKSGYNFIIFDTPPGFSLEEADKYWDEAIIVTTPEMPSFASCIRLSNLYDKQHLKHNIIVNRYKNRRYELSISEMSDTYGNRPLRVLPEDDKVPESVAAHIPSVILSRRSPFSREILSLARSYKTRAGVEATESMHEQGVGFWAAFRRLFGIGR